MTKTEARKSKWKKFWERNKRSEGYLLKKVIGNYAYRIVRMLMLFGLCFLILQPIFNKISVSFMAEEDLYNAMVINVPEHFTSANYEMAATFMEYGEALKNTLIISLTIALLQVAVCTLVGYGFARFEFPFKKFWFACVILIIVIPPQTIATSLHLHFRFFDVFGIIEAVKGETLNLRGSVLPYYLMSAGCMGPGEFIPEEEGHQRRHPAVLRHTLVAALGGVAVPGGVLEPLGDGHNVKQGSGLHGIDSFRS